MRKSRFTEAQMIGMIKEQEAGMCFNILVGNTDDHVRNHAAFRDGHQVELTPACDLDLRPRRSHEANQAMAIAGAARQSRLAGNNPALR